MAEEVQIHVLQEKSCGEDLFNEVAHPAEGGMGETSLPARVAQCEKLGIVRHVPLPAEEQAAGSAGVWKPEDHCSRGLDPANGVQQWVVECRGQRQAGHRISPSSMSQLVPSGGLSPVSYQELPEMVTLGSR